MMIFDDATQTFLLDSFIVLGFVVFGVLFFLYRRWAGAPVAGGRSHSNSN